MHELSVAEAILNLAAGHVPPGAVVTRLHVRAGAMQSIDAESLQWAWEGVREQRSCLSGSELELRVMPWSLRCPLCGAAFVSDDPFARCACGCDRAYPSGGDELLLEAIDVEDLSGMGASPMRSRRPAPPRECTGEAPVPRSIRPAPGSAR